MALLRQVFAGVLASNTATGSVYAGPTFSTYDWEASTASGSAAPWAVAGTFQHAAIELTAGPGTGKTLTYTLVKNGVDTALTITIADLATTGSSAATVAVAAGDLLHWRRTASAAPAVAFTKASVEFVSTGAASAGYAAFHLSLSGSVVNRSPLLFPETMGTGVVGPNVHEVVAVAGTITAVRYRLLTAPGSGKSFLLVLYLNGVKQDGTGGTVDTRVTIADAATTGTWTGSLAVTAGQYLVLESTPTGTPAAVNASYGVAFVATTASYSAISGYVAGTLPSSGIRYAPLHAESTWNNTETEATVKVGAAGAGFTLRDLHVRTGANLSGSVTFTVRQNGVDTALAVTLAATGGAAVGSNLVQTVTVNPGDTLTLKSSGTPTTSVVISFSLAVVAEVVVDITVPDIVGETEAAADTILVGVGLVTGTVTTAYDDTVAAGLVISQSPTAGSEVEPGSAVDYVVSLGPEPPPGWRLLIDGVEQTPLVDAVTISWQLNDRTRATVVISDLIPDRYADLVSYAKDGVTPLFGGMILTRAFAGRNQYDPDYQVTNECGDYFAMTDWAIATLTYETEVTLKTVLTDLVDDYLDAYGITLDAGQVDGPLLAPFAWTDKRISDGIRELSERTGYVARISPTKALEMFVPGTDAAPFTVTEAETNVVEVSWRDSEQAQPANFITLVYGPNGQADVLNERHYGDGVTRSWVLDAPYVAHYGALHIFSELAGAYPVGRYGLDDMPWTVDAATSTVYQRVDQTVIDSDDYWWFDAYIGQFPGTVTATTGETPVIHRKERREDVLSRPVAQAIADSLLEAASGETKEITVTTDVDGLEVGQLIEVDLPTTRSITGEFVITSLSMTIVQDPDGGEAYWVYRAEAIDSTIYQGNYLDQWRKLIVGGGLGSTTPGNAGGPIGVAPIYLGGNRAVSLSADPAAWQPVVNYIQYTASTNFTGRVRADLSALDPAVGVQARLFNVTDSTVAGTSIVVVAPATTDMFIAVIEAGKTYRLEVIADTDAEEIFAIGTLEAT